MSRIAVIPARGGSTRLKDKNIYPLNGKPLISYMIESVIESRKFDKIYVSTDSDKIANIAKEYEVFIYQREPKFATTKITVLEAIVDMMSKIDKSDVLGYFLPTCPLTTPQEISKAVDMLVEGVDSVVSVVEYDFPIQLSMMKREEEEFIPVFDNLTSGLTNSKFINKYYHPTGAFYISRWDNIIENKNFFVGKIKGVEMSKENYIDINDIEDMKRAEYALRRKNEIK